MRVCRRTFLSTYEMVCAENAISRTVSKGVVAVSLSGWSVSMSIGLSVEGSNHVEAERAIMDGQWKAETYEGFPTDMPSSRVLWKPGKWMSKLWSHSFDNGYQNDVYPWTYIHSY